MAYFIRVMGESRRRQTALKEKYGQETRFLSWLPISKGKAQQFIDWSTRGAWIGIGLLVAWWLTVLFLGPALGWWQVT